VSGGRLVEETEGPAIEGELKSVLSSAIAELPADYRTAFLLRDVEGLRIPRSPRRCRSSWHGEVARAPDAPSSCGGAWHPIWMNFGVAQEMESFATATV